MSGQDHNARRDKCGKTSHWKGGSSFTLRTFELELDRVPESPVLLDPDSQYFHAVRDVERRV